MMIYSKLLGTGILLTGVAMPALVHAADAVVEDPLPIAEMAPSDVWSGFYVGALAGYTWLDADGRYEGEGIDEGQVDGGLLGGQIGYNFQINRTVLGIEADVAYSSASGEVVNDDDEGADTDLNYLATVRGRAGMVFGAAESTLLFATAGLAIGDFESEFEGQSDGDTHLGYVVGVGVEQMVTEKISVKAEYNYVDFGAEDYDDNEGTDIEYDGHVVKLGVNFHF
jgi:outer membrane immunogenic protein